MFCSSVHCFSGLSGPANAPGLKNRNIMPSFAPLISLRANSRSCASVVGTNHCVILPPSSGKVFEVELNCANSDGYPLPAALIWVHSSRKYFATSGSSTIRPLLACVHKPVIVQLVLPVITLNGVPLESQSTTNLLCAKWPLPTSRSCRSTLVLRSARTFLFSSLSGGLNAPLASTKWH